MGKNENFKLFVSTFQTLERKKCQKMTNVFFSKFTENCSLETLPL